MYFSDIVKEVGAGRYKFEPDSQYIFEIDKSNFKIAFTMDYATIIVGKVVKEFNLNDFAKFQFTLIKAKAENEKDSMELSFNDEKLLTLPVSKMEGYKDLFSSLERGFADGQVCSPAYQMHTLIEEWNIDFSELKDYVVKKIIFLYKDRFEAMVNDSFLEEGSKILFFVEEHSGGVGSIRSTAKKAFGKVLSGGLSVIAKASIDIAKAGATRIAKNIASEFISEHGILIITDRNVIFSSKDIHQEYDFDDAQAELKSQQDETLVGVVDIYDDVGGNKLLENISQNDWGIFKKTLKKIRKGEYGLLESPTIKYSAVGTTSHTDDLTEKLKKLKYLLDDGILSEYEFTTKKQELLGLNKSTPVVAPDQFANQQIKSKTNSVEQKPKKKQKTWIRC